MSRNTLYAVVAIAVVALVVVGYMIYRDQQTERFEINVGGQGISIEKK